METESGFKLKGTLIRGKLSSLQKLARYKMNAVTTEDVFRLGTEDTLYLGARVNLNLEKGIDLVDMQIILHDLYLNGLIDYSLTPKVGIEYSVAKIRVRETLEREEVTPPAIARRIASLVGADPSIAPLFTLFAEEYVYSNTPVDRASCLKKLWRCSTDVIQRPDYQNLGFIKRTHSKRLGILISRAHMLCCFDAIRIMYHHDFVDYRSDIKRALQGNGTCKRIVKEKTGYMIPSFNINDFRADMIMKSLNFVQSY